MDKNAIKKYALWARRELISRVAQKAMQYEIADKKITPATATSVNGVVLSAEETKQRKALIEQINAKGYEQVMEEVAYTWFNRFIALRFMEVNGYLPSRVRVFTDENNAFNPQILTEAISLEMAGLDMERVYALKDANDEDGLFKYLVIVQCNALSSILPRMFQRISDYTELLFPDNLLREGSVIEQMISGIPEEDWKDAVQIIGWLYQFYNGEKKDAIFAALKKSVKITKENIPAATQLFTPDWIVRYMVENSLGRLWLEGHPNDQLRAGWQYYIDEATQEIAVQSQLAVLRKKYAAITPEQIKCIDPCAGSGHILVYMFDVLVQIYEAYGYTAREAVRSIIKNNLYGLDIDDRAAQLAYFAVMMKARQYDRRFLSRKDENGAPDVPQPHVYAVVESNAIDNYALDYYINGDPKLRVAMGSIVREMRDAKEYGSILNITPVDFDALFARFDEVQNDISIARDTVLGDILPLVQTAAMLCMKYDVVVTNPPYAGRRHLNSKICNFLDGTYPEGKMDLFAAFILKNTSMTKTGGFVGFMTPFVWLYLSSYAQLRSFVLNSSTIATYMQPEESSFKDAAVSLCSFVTRKGNGNYKGKYIRFHDISDMDEQAEVLRQIASGEDLPYTFSVNQNIFAEYPDSRMIYWENEAFQRTFAAKQKLDEVCQPRQGMATTNNDLFLRLWHETEYRKIGFAFRDEDEAEASGLKWFPYNKGGGFRKWYGNNEYVVNYEYRGKTICDYIDNTPGARVGSNGRVINRQFFFHKSITWSDICGSNFAARSCPNGFIFDVKGSSAFVSEQLYEYILAFLNTKVNVALLNGLNPSVTTQVGDLKQLPFIYDHKKAEQIIRCVREAVALSKEDWDSFETSWDYEMHPMVRLSRDLWDATAVGASMAYYYGNQPKVSGPLELCYMLWQGECSERFKKLREQEEELNRIFIEIYGLGDNLSPSVDENDVTVELANKKRDIKSLISYAVGCMFGRYSLDAPGLVYAGGEWEDSKYVTFQADKDSIIPICDDEYFSDDVVGRFIRFIEVVFGKDTLQENLRFIADALGGNGQPKDVIRNYFLNDFYADHLKIYQKRPIYWLFDSGKKSGFKALVYMHRYQPDTIARMRTDYVHEQQARYRTAIADMEQRIASASTSERVKLSKRLKTLQEQAAEIQGYEEKIHHLADQYISIDLDDGVKKNYAIFEDVLTKIK